VRIHKVLETYNLSPLQFSCLQYQKLAVYTAEVSRYSSSLPHTHTRVGFGSSSYCSLFSVCITCCMNEFNKFKPFNFIFSAVFLPVKQSLLQAYFRPLGLLNVEAPRVSRQSAGEGGKVVSPRHWPPLPPGDISATCYY
jgi:hypothetical protein